MNFKDCVESNASLKLTKSSETLDTAQFYHDIHSHLIKAETRAIACLSQSNSSIDSSFADIESDSITQKLSLFLEQTQSLPLPWPHTDTIPMRIIDDIFESLTFIQCEASFLVTGSAEYELAASGSSYDKGRIAKFIWIMNRLSVNHSELTSLYTFDRRLQYRSNVLISNDVFSIEVLYGVLSNDRFCI